jgi:hypothetical protein
MCESELRIGRPLPSDGQTYDHLLVAILEIRSGARTLTGHDSLVRVPGFKPGTLMRRYATRMPG